MKYSFITQHQNTYPISLQCQVLGVSRQGYYYHQKHVVSKSPDPERQMLLTQVKVLAADSDNTYGSRRIAKAFTTWGVEIRREI